MTPPERYRQPAPLELVTVSLVSPPPSPLPTARSTSRLLELTLRLADDVDATYVHRRLLELVEELTDEHVGHREFVARRAADDARRVGDAS